MNTKKTENQEKVERGERIRIIREKELKMTKTQLAKKLGISSQFLGLVETGRGNLMYNSLKKLKNLCGHSADYILYGLDDEVLRSTNQFLERYTETELICTINLLKNIALCMKNNIENM